MIPLLEKGVLPPGVHECEWQDVASRFGYTPHRSRLIAGLRQALHELARAGCRRVYLDGSFVTDKFTPNDYDLCWEMDHVDVSALDPIVKDLAPPRTAQHAKYLGDLMPNVLEQGSGRPLLEFFQIDKNTGATKGILALDPRKVGP